MLLRSIIAKSTRFPLTPAYGHCQRLFFSDFKLSKAFIDKYRKEVPPFGFNGLGELVYRRTYARIKSPPSYNPNTTETNTPSSSNQFEYETWSETVERVVNATFNMQKRWFEMHSLEWSTSKAQRSAQEMYRRIFTFKFLPPGRGLWAMGSPLTEERGLFAALNNCAFVSTENMSSKPFVFLMDSAMLGIGVGFDVKGTGFYVKGPNKSKKPEEYVVDDSREGWVEAVRRLLDSYFEHTPVQRFDLSNIRPAGTPIRGFGGLAAGPAILRNLLTQLTDVLDSCVDKKMTITNITDIFNLIGAAVVAGNNRQTAEIVFGPPDSEEYLDLKNYKVNPHRASYGWTSNNSIFAEIGMDYKPVIQRIVSNGEPGFVWLQNMQNYGRMNGKVDKRDARVQGCNPCAEQSLESYEMCCLVETFPNNHTSKEDFLETLKYAYLYAKTVTLGKTHWPETNRVMLRNRRIGCSMSGLAQFVGNHGIENLRDWCESGYAAIQEYDAEYSDLFAIPRSIKCTSIKPSGTVSLLAGATPGVHFPSSRFYIRRVRFSKTSPLLGPLRKAGYKVEPSVTQPDYSVVVEFPVDAGANVRTNQDMSMWEQLSFAAFLQKHWADNQVSCTVTFDPAKEVEQLEPALNFFQYQLKGVSFLPKLEDGAYEQMPLEAITEERYNQMVAGLTKPDFDAKPEADSRPEQNIVEKFCDTETCSLTADPVEKSSPSSSLSSPAVSEEADDMRSTKPSTTL